MLKCFGSFMRLILVFCCHHDFVCVSIIRPTAGEIIVPPTDEEVVVSHNVTLKCWSNTSAEYPITWYHLQLDPNKFDELLYEDSYYFNGQNYKISGNTSQGEFNLVISNVKLSDAGRYTCRDKDRSQRRAELIVYESYPDVPSCVTNQPPDGFVGANKCGITPDTLRFSCNTSYSGNLKPILEWRQGSEDLTNATMERSDTSITSSIELTADENRSPNFQCRVRYSNSDIESKFIWQTTVQVLSTKTKNYSASCRESPNQTVDCAFTTLHRCSYTWIKSNSNWSFSGSILNLSSAEEAAVYICHADCLVRDTKCNFTPAQVAYSCDLNDEKSTNIATTFIVVIVVLPVIIALILIGIIWILKRCIFSQSFNWNERIPVSPTEEPSELIPKVITSQEAADVAEANL